jgi:hypothetical protein
MDVFRFLFDAKRLRAVPDRYLGFLIASSHCCNELAILQPYILFEHDLKRANDVECAFILTRKFTIDRILISKIVEYGELCLKFFEDNNGSRDQLLLELSKNYEPIAAQIKSAKWARILRNKISFHYDYKQAISALSKLDDAHPLQLIAGRIKGVTLFDFAEEIVSRPIFEAAGGGDIGKGMDVANQFIVSLINSITSFHAQTTIALFTSFGMISERVQSELREKYCAAPGKIRVPISISSAYLKSCGTKKAKKTRRSAP